MWADPGLSKEQVNMLPGNLADYLPAQLEGLEAALQAGWQLLVNIPLRYEGKVLGLLSIFSQAAAYPSTSARAYAPQPAGKLVLRQLQLYNCLELLGNRLVWL